MRSVSTNLGVEFSTQKSDVLLDLMHKN